MLNTKFLDLRLFPMQTSLDRRCCGRPDLGWPGGSNRVPRFQRRRGNIAARAISSSDGIHHPSNERTTSVSVGTCTFGIQNLLYCFYAASLSHSSSSSSRSHLVVGSLRQTQFSSSQFFIFSWTFNFVFCCSDGPRISVDTVLPSLHRYIIF